MVQFLPVQREVVGAQIEQGGGKGGVRRRDGGLLQGPGHRAFRGAAEVDPAGAMGGECFPFQPVQGIPQPEDVPFRAGIVCFRRNHAYIQVAAAIQPISPAIGTVNIY